MMVMMLMVTVMVMVMVMMILTVMLMTVVMIERIRMVRHVFVQSTAAAGTKEGVRLWCRCWPSSPNGFMRNRIQTENRAHRDMVDNQEGITGVVDQRCNP